MIHYHPGKWSVAFAFSWRGSVLGKAFVWAFPVAVMTAITHFALRTDALKNKIPMMEEGASVMSNYTFVLGFLIVFRVNQAYSRWWEGGSLLQQIRGEWFNAYSSLVAFSNQSKDMATDVLKFQHQLARLISLLYGVAIQQVSTAESKVMEIIDIEGFQLEHIQFMQQAHDRVEIVLQWTQKLIVEANNKELVKIAPPILSRVYNQLGNGIVNLNNARKIADFPIPFPLAQMITLMLMAHWVVTCAVCATSVRTPVEGSMLAFIIVFSFQSINYIAVELEMPFGDGANDLPIKDMQEDMDASLIALLDKRAQTVPTHSFKPHHVHLVTKLVDYEDHLAAMAAGSVDLHPTKRRGRRELHGLKEKTHRLLHRRRRRGKSLPLLTIGRSSDSLQPQLPVPATSLEQLGLVQQTSPSVDCSRASAAPASTSAAVQLSQSLVKSTAAEPKDGASEEAPVEAKDMTARPMRERRGMADVSDGQYDWCICPCGPNGQRDPRLGSRASGTYGHVGQQYIVASSSAYGNDQSRSPPW